MNSREKTKFRNSKEWHNFRQSIIESRGSRCECCGRILPSGKLQLHHIKPENYTDLNPDNFALLCSYCHEDVERLSKMKLKTRLQIKKDYIAPFERFITN